MPPHVLMASSNNNNYIRNSSDNSSDNSNNSRSSSSSSNGNSNINNRSSDDCIEDRVCRYCHARGSLRIDWAQGDCVCTSCGVVDEERLLDDRPEWKDFGEAEDLVKGLPSGARCGLVAVDESKYLGGLQPTTLSKRPFGTTIVAGSAAIRKSLNATNRKMDSMMEKEHKRALKRAKLSRNIQKKQILVELHDDDVAPEHDAIVLQEEEEAERLHAALHAEKWSLDRALLLHGNTGALGDSSATTNNQEEEREELVSRMDASLKRAAFDLYTAYTLLTQAAQRLDLSIAITRDATHTMCQYAKQKDGLSVKGVSSRLSSSAISKEAADKLRDFNKQKQMAALAAALLFLEARKHGHSRLLQEVCASFAACNNDTATASSATATNGILSIEIKPKHCGKAMNELRNTFPEYMRSANVVHPSLSSSTASHENSSNFVEHATRKLKLPPVATVCIQSLVTHEVSSAQQGNDSTAASVAAAPPKLSTVCASMTLFITMVGTIMQRLAQQAAPYQTSPSFSASNHQKLLKQDEHNNDSNNNDSKKKKSKSRSFDLFAHPAVEQESYEMRQVWDAWLEQMSWNRSIADILQSFGGGTMSQAVVLEHYKRHIYPKRGLLLSKLATTEFKSTPRATLLLSQVPCASALLNSQGTV